MRNLEYFLTKIIIKAIIQKYKYYKLIYIVLEKRGGKPNDT